MTGGLISPPQSCSNSPSLPISSLSASRFAPLLPPRLVQPDLTENSGDTVEQRLPDSIEQSGDVVDQNGQPVSTEQGENPGDTVEEHLPDSIEQSGVAVDQTGQPVSTEQGENPGNTVEEHLPDPIEQPGVAVDQNGQPVSTEEAGSCPGSSTRAVSEPSPRSSSSSLLESPQAELRTSTEDAGHELGNREQPALVEKGDSNCASSKPLPRLSSSSSSESPQAELRHSTEDTEHELGKGEQPVLTDKGGCLSSGNWDMRSRRSSVASSLSSTPPSSEDEENQRMAIVEQRSTGSSSEEEEKDTQMTEGSEEDGEGESMAGIERTYLPVDSLDHNETEAMDVDANLSVDAAAPFQPRRSLRRAVLMTKPRPQPESVVPETTTKRKGPPTMKIHPLAVGI